MTRKKTVAVPEEPRRREVRVLQIDTRSPQEAMHSAIRTWPGGGSHQELEQRYFGSNPTPPKRPYWVVSAIANARHCRHKGWRYDFLTVPEPQDRHPSWIKIRHVLEAWDSLPADGVVVVLDTDAWIRDADGFEHLLDTRLTGDTLYLAAGEPDVVEARNNGADVLNGGFMCFVPHPRVRDFLQQAWDLPDVHSDCARFRRDWPWEQACLSRVHREVRPDWMHILPVAMCNTPAGTHVTHCWFKNITYDLALDDLLGSLCLDLLPVERPTMEFVVARYNEDVAWLWEWVPFVDRVTVYDKSPEPMESAHPKVTVVPLPNVGRESHTYAHHFAERYDDLCDVVVCTQGRYEDHLCKSAFDAMVRGQEQGPANGLDMPWHTAPMQHFGWTVDANWSPQPMQPAGMTMAKFFLQLCGDDIQPADQVRWWHGAIFRTTATAVRRHPRARWQAILDTVGVGPNPEAGHMMERFWRVMVGPR